MSTAVQQQMSRLQRWVTKEPDQLRGEIRMHFGGQHLCTGEALIPRSCSFPISLQGVVVLLDACCSDADVVDHMQQIASMMASESMRPA